MIRIIRLLALVVVLPFPWLIRRFVYRYIFGFKISRTARIGLSILDVEYLDMGDNSKIGSFNMLWNLESVILEPRASIATFNWIAGYRRSVYSHFQAFPDRTSSLILRVDSAITARHLLDCTDLIEIGAFSTIAGHRSQFLTHSIDFILNTQSCSPIKIGSYCFVGTGCILLKGVNISDRIIVAAGTIVHKNLEEHEWIYGGSPAKRIRKLDSDVLYFKRMIGRVN